MAIRRGQALMELIMGIFALSLVTAVLCAFAAGIAKSLKEQNSSRKPGGDWKIKDRIELPENLWKMF